MEPKRPSAKRRWKVAAALVVFLGVIAFLVGYFEPQKLVIDERVDEPALTGSAAEVASTLAPSVESSTPPVTTTVPGVLATKPVEIVRGTFRSLEHSTTGSAVVSELADGTQVLRLEGFETSNGPDLRVYLSAGSSDAGFGREYGLDFVELGELKGNIGSQNYMIPAGVDLAKYNNAVIWCKRFSVGFGVATLQ